jgi:8-oxo-dGTP pyrophosphatase MutT (NUDIX family)
MTALVQYLQHLKFTFSPWSWSFAEDRRREIDEFFRRECEKNPALWNGRLLLLRNANVADGTMSGSFFETDYASLLAGLAWDAMGETVKACFPAAAVLASDGTFIVGEMAEYTRNAGELLLPAGSVERGDVIDDRVDFFGTLRRELGEETGLISDTLEPESGWYAVTVGSRLPLIKIMRSKEVAETLKQRISTNLAAQIRPEFRKVLAVRDASDLSDRMPLWVTAFLRHVWQVQAFGSARMQTRPQRS